MTNGHEAPAPGAGNYASVNGLNMYYEVHGTGQPLVVLHGAYMTIETMGEIVCRPSPRPGRSSPQSCRGTGTRRT
jgi:hypothetical protein